MDAQIISESSISLQVRLPWPGASRPCPFSKPLNLNLTSQVLEFLFRLHCYPTDLRFAGSVQLLVMTIVVVILELVTALLKPQIST